MVVLFIVLIKWFLLLSYLFTVQATSDAIIPEADIIVNVEKGFVLQRIGTFSHKINEGIIHTFVSLNDLCKSSPGSAACLRASGLMENSIELGTILSVNDKHWSLSRYEKKDISATVRQATNSLLLNYKPGQFLSNIPTNFHFFNGDFYVHTQNDPLVNSTFDFTDGKNELAFNNVKNTSLIVLEQLRNHRIGFNFLKDEEIHVILSPIMQSIDKSYQTANVQKMITDFIPLIISQTVNAFRSCSISQDDLSSPPCLIISTLFTIPSSLTADKYTIYNLLPIPIIMNGYQYSYKNLPKTFAFNDIEQRVIVFDDYLLSRCILSSIVQCSIEPMPMLLSQFSCLSYMFSVQSSKANDCEVARSVSSNFALLYITQDIWIFDNINGNERCTTQTHQTETRNLSNMEDLIIEHVNCGKSIKCSNHRRLPSKCINKTIMTLDKENEFYKPQANFQITFKSLTKTILAKYKKDMLSLLQEIQAYDDETATVITRLYRKFFNLIICIVLLFMLTLISVCGKYICKKFQRQNIVERRLNNLSDIFFNHDNQV